MLLALLAAHAAEPPDPPDAARVAMAAVTGVTDFPGCNRFEGELTQVNALLGLRTALAFAWSGTLDSGAWTRWTSRRTDDSRNGILVSTDVGGVSFRFLVPLFGAFVAGPAPAPSSPPGPSSVATGPATDDAADTSVAHTSRKLFLELLTAAGTAVELETVEPVHDAPTPTIRYTRSFSSRRTVLGRKENLVEVLLDAASLRPRAWRVQLDTPVALPDTKGRIVRMDASLAVDPEGWPALDDLDVTGAFGPILLRVRRVVTFRRLGPCAP